MKFDREQALGVLRISTDLVKEASVTKQQEAKAGIQAEKAMGDAQMTPPPKQPTRPISVPTALARQSRTPPTNVRTSKLPQPKLPMQLAQKQGMRLGTNFSTQKMSMNTGINLPMIRTAAVKMVKGFAHKEKVAAPAFVQRGMMTNTQRQQKPQPPQRGMSVSKNPLRYAAGRLLHDLNPLSSGQYQGNFNKAGLAGARSAEKAIDASRRADLKRAVRKGGAGNLAKAVWKHPTTWDASRFAAGMAVPFPAAGAITRGAGALTSWGAKAAGKGLARLNTAAGMGAARMAGRGAARHAAKNTAGSAVGKAVSALPQKALGQARKAGRAVQGRYQQYAAGRMDRGLAATPFHRGAEGGAPLGQQMMDAVRKGVSPNTVIRGEQAMAQAAAGNAAGAARAGRSAAQGAFRDISANLNPAARAEMGKMMGQAGNALGRMFEAGIAGAQRGYTSKPSMLRRAAGHLGIRPKATPMQNAIEQGYLAARGAAGKEGAQLFNRFMHRPVGQLAEGGARTAARKLTRGGVVLGGQGMAFSSEPAQRIGHKLMSSGRESFQELPQNYQKAKDAVTGALMTPQQRQARAKVRAIDDRWAKQRADWDRARRSYKRRIVPRKNK